MTEYNNWELYMVQTAHQTIYTGISCGRRPGDFTAHCMNRGAKYLRNKQPLQLVYRSNCQFHSVR
ncbi:hypothetical protein [Mocis latipes granulovirus]|uniref:Uncharacterized protein n=1 Tax=Mocis latipes granulovirus TaxID=2072024 RepID=A0A162GVL7_9BBAC|nr:hypothetical protein [Mocis latipes granulovirus]AKR17428.1 hypothetical protein [Mocis latipes granulovirus]